MGVTFHHINIHVALSGEKINIYQYLYRYMNICKKKKSRNGVIALTGFSESLCTMYFASVYDYRLNPIQKYSPITKKPLRWIYIATPHEFRFPSITKIIEREQSEQVDSLEEICLQGKFQHPSMLFNHKLF